MLLTKLNYWPGWGSGGMAHHAAEGDTHISRPLASPPAADPLPR
jgi:hypothetical protein